MRFVLTFLLSLCVTPAFALDHCEEWWFTRNLVFDRAGYCFSSPLGQAVFDNSDCFTPPYSSKTGFSFGSASLRVLWARFLVRMATA